MNTDNELIAEFMGFSQGKSELGNTWEHPDKMGIYGGVGQKFKYDVSWDWLMPVVEKIGNLDEEWINNEREINNEGLLIFELGSIFVPLPDVYKAVVEFIKWYNQQQKS